MMLEHFTTVDYVAGILLLAACAVYMFTHKNDVFP